ncbi:hypothetical protein GQ53DRAFT_743693 [Thozetella sp. PMI_491]|nr:hypothetical protein GQ53DRAFT_743693 [Thozetella sp. PMI_491]
MYISRVRAPEHHSLHDPHRLRRCRHWFPTIVIPFPTADETTARFSSRARLTVRPITSAAFQFLPNIPS